MRKIFQYWTDTYFLFARDLEKEMEFDYRIPGGYSLIIIKSEKDVNLDSLCSLWAKAYHSSKNSLIVKNRVKSLIRRGDVCFCVLFQGKAVGMAWSGGKKAIQEIDFAQILKREKLAALGHHDFVDEEHRGHGFQKILSLSRVNYAKKNGFTKYYVFVGVKNAASLKNLAKVFNEYKIVFHLKIDIPLRTFNFFPGANRENWALCQENNNLRQACE